MVHIREGITDKKKKSTTSTAAVVTAKDNATRTISTAKQYKENTNRSISGLAVHEEHSDGSWDDVSSGTASRRRRKADGSGGNDTSGKNTSYKKLSPTEVLEAAEIIGPPTDCKLGDWNDWSLCVFLDGDELESSKR